MEKQLATLQRKVVNGKVRYEKACGKTVATVKVREDGFYVGTLATGNVLFVVSPNLWAMLDKDGYMFDTVDYASMFTNLLENQE